MLGSDPSAGAGAEACGRAFCAATFLPSHASAYKAINPGGLGVGLQNGRPLGFYVCCSSIGVFIVTLKGPSWSAGNLKTLSFILI